MQLCTQKYIASRQRGVHLHPPYPPWIHHWVVVVVVVVVVLVVVDVVVVVVVVVVVLRCIKAWDMSFLH